MSTDFSYAPTNDQLVGVFIGIIFLHGLINTLNTAWLARITTVRHRQTRLRLVVFIPEHRKHNCHHNCAVRRRNLKYPSRQ